MSIAESSLWISFLRSDNIVVGCVEAFCESKLYIASNSNDTVVTLEFVDSLS